MSITFDILSSNTICWKFIYINLLRVLLISFSFLKMQPVKRANKESYRYGYRTLIGNWLEDVALMQVNYYM